MKQALIFWFTGLSGSGKTTIALRVKQLLVAQGLSVVILDGDDVRERLHQNLGFSEADIKLNNSLIVKLCQQYRSQADVILVPIISPYAESRNQAKKLLGDDFYEVYFSASLATVVKRDVKGLYARAKKKEITDLIGYFPGIAYEVPANPDFIVDSNDENVAESSAGLFQFITNALGIKEYQSG